MGNAGSRDIGRPSAPARASSCGATDHRRLEGIRLSSITSGSRGVAFPSPAGPAGVRAGWGGERSEVAKAVLRATTFCTIVTNTRHAGRMATGLLRRSPTKRQTCPSDALERIAPSAAQQISPPPSVPRPLDRTEAPHRPTCGPRRSDRLSQRQTHAEHRARARFTSSLRPLAAARATTNSAGTWSPVPRYISSGVCPWNAACGTASLCSLT